MRWLLATESGLCLNAEPPFRYNLDPDTGYPRLKAKMHLFEFAPKAVHQHSTNGPINGLGKCIPRKCNTP